MKTKTYKREVAGAMLLYLGVMFAVGVSNEQAMQAAEFLTLPIFGFAGAAFALDWRAKQST